MSLTIPAPRASNPQGVVELRRLVGVGFGVAVVLGGMIGIGILRTPEMVAGWVSSPSLIMALWAVAGLYILINALCLAELAAAFPRAGGPYVFARRAFGDFAGFAVGWVDWSLNAGGVAFLAVAFADYAGLIVPAIGGHTGVSAASLIGVLALLNWFGLSLGSVVQQTLSALKAIAFLVLIVGCFVHGQPSGVTAVSAVHLPTATVPLILGVVLSLQPILEAYGVWNSAVYFAEEDQNPERTTYSRSMVGGLLLVMAIYLLTNAALLHVLTVPEIASTTIPAALAAERSFGAHSGILITVLALVSLLAIANTLMMFVPRILFGLSRDGLFNARGATLNRYGTPGIALILSAATAAALALSGTFEMLFAAVSFLHLCINVASRRRVIQAAPLDRRRSATCVFSAVLSRGCHSIALGGSVAILGAFLVGNTLNSLASIGAIILVVIRCTGSCGAWRPSRPDAGGSPGAQECSEPVDLRRQRIAKATAAGWSPRSRSGVPHRVFHR